MTVPTALQQNLEEVQATARRIDRLEQRASRLRATMLQLLVQDGGIAGGTENDAVVPLSR